MTITHRISMRGIKMMRCSVEIATGFVTGSMARRALNMVLERLEKHRDELMDDWQRARQRRPLQVIAPLD
jgi:hypothetical protein